MVAAAALIGVSNGLVTTSNDRNSDRVNIPVSTRQLVGEQIDETEIVY